MVVWTTQGSFRGDENLGASDVFARAFGSADREMRWSLQFGTTDRDTAGWAWGGGNSVYVIGDTSGAFPGETSSGSVDTYLTRIDVHG